LEPINSNIIGQVRASWYKLNGRQHFLAFCTFLGHVTSMRLRPLKGPMSVHVTQSYVRRQAHEGARVPAGLERFPWKHFDRAARPAGSHISSSSLLLSSLELSDTTIYEP